MYIAVTRFCKAYHLLTSEIIRISILCHLIDDLEHTILQLQANQKYFCKIQLTERYTSYIGCLTKVILQ